MRLLITGICGFVGSILAHECLAAREGVEIIGLDNLSRSGSEANLAPLRRCGITVLHGDLRSPADLAALPPVDWVIDAAANPSVLAGFGDTSSRLLVEHNLIGTVNLLEYCKRQRAGLILLSTSRVYALAALNGLPLTIEDAAFALDTGRALPVGTSLLGINEQFDTRPPLSLYGSTKLCSEIMAREYGAAFGFPVWINRCGLLAGAGQFGRPDQGIVAYWIHAWLRGRPLAYTGFGGHGHQVRDCLHPRDLLPALLKQMEQPEHSTERVFNFGGGVDRAFSLAQLSRFCTERFGPRTVVSVAERHPFDAPWMVMDSSLAARTWGWQPPTGLHAIFDEVAAHAEVHPDWLERSGVA